MALPTITRDDVSRVLKLTPHIHTLALLEGAIEHHPDLHTSINTMSETGFIAPFDWSAEFSDRLDDLTDDDLIKNADLETLRKLFTAHVRLNRFRQGYLDEIIKQGKWALMLSRLQWLYDHEAV